MTVLSSMSIDDIKPGLKIFSFKFDARGEVVSVVNHDITVEINNRLYVYHHSKASHLLIFDVKPRKSLDEIAEACVDQIIYDLTNRTVIDLIWQDIDDDIKAEIRENWQNIIMSEMR